VAPVKVLVKSIPGKSSITNPALTGNYCDDGIRCPSGVADTQSRSRLHNFLTKNQNHENSLHPLPPQWPWRDVRRASGVQRGQRSFLNRLMSPCFQGYPKGRVNVFVLLEFFLMGAGFDQLGFLARNAKQY
jgi:hypothetical protein